MSRITSSGDQELPCNAEDRTRVGHMQGKGLNPCTISLFLHWELGLDVKDGGHLVIQNRREDTVGAKEKKQKKGPER